MKPPRHSIEAEQACLGSALISRKAAELVCSELRDEDFYIGPHRRVCAVIRHLIDRRVTPDVLTVPEELASRGELAGVGGLAYIGTLAESVPTAAHANHYVAIVARHALARNAVDLLREAATTLQSELCDDPQSELDGLAVKILKHHRASDTQSQTLGTALVDEITRISEGTDETTVGIGIPSVDRISGGISAGDVAIIAGQPGSGKSVMMMQAALTAAQALGNGAVVSLEMKPSHIARRLLCRETGYSFSAIRDRRYWDADIGRYVEFGDQDREKLSKAASRADDIARRITILTGCWKLSSLVAAVRRARVETDIRWCCIDYAQLIETERRGEGLYELTQTVCKAVKNEIAGALDIPVYLLAQPNRAWRTDDRTKEKRGRMLVIQDLAGGSALEATASSIYLLNRDPAAPPPPEDGREERTPILLEIGKSRNEARGRIPLTFIGRQFLFVDRDETHEPEHHHHATTMED